MKQYLGLLIALLLLGYGVIRIGVGTALLAQTVEIISFPDLAEATSEVKEFIADRNEKQVIPFSPAGYFAYILGMGLVLSLGALGTIRRRRWGFVMLWGYLGLHGALFLNYQEVNPKLLLFGVQILLLLGLRYLRPPSAAAPPVEMAEIS